VHVEAEYQETAARAALLFDFPLMKARLVKAAAEAGHHDEAAILLDLLAPNDFAAVARDGSLPSHSVRSPGPSSPSTPVHTPPCSVDFSASTPD
jgi:hypothetical protein